MPNNVLSISSLVNATDADPDPDQQGGALWTPFLSKSSVVYTKQSKIQHEQEQVPKIQAKVGNRPVIQSPQIISINNVLYAPIGVNNFNGIGATIQASSEPQLQAAQLKSTACPEVQSMLMDGTFTFNVKKRKLEPEFILESGTMDNSNKKRRKKFTSDDLRILEEIFMREPLPCQARREELAKQLGRSTRSVQIWFQNRRAKQKDAPQEATTTTNTTEEAQPQALQVLSSSRSHEPNPKRQTTASKKVIN